ncbi:uncharacterized protein RHIMIDRAFT_237303 [Rhizopus microsporus ATCC 52813]|uniref:Uncharacterized protein n=1 Tax=Rhizopus microsporus ATCC 52813 TaxID=1340429 RepID=A0A2G4SWY5_RHIZD|nr:uncharacterized protein RHIMIDRAFT_237303 [Rhizopus microsporus ATCC 52813]PHZ13290.1 hypothetical protein RHIMIDRAFT_237303 [Rhizopus microsporus ATCC 52813]
MSRFTEHFDIYVDPSAIVYSSTLTSPSKASFSSTSTYSSRSAVDPYDPFNSTTTTSTTTTTINDASPNKLKRFFTTISKKKRSIPFSEPIKMDNDAEHMA